ncbi:aurora kinase A and ninein-interacting protein [Anguilla anguilla]|uniref:aurora kinase A and ninein-interacting protein n=1 Tax=Anguilla anguilla TaxID=7936 RepID=UPI0015AA12A8|nr:aurora kinase A and ninein-interacting protein [Anguilla anguilla]XP_035286153.1 aurora kinase A and ninein-interacting protein [Anguilla anguilla]
MKACKVPASTQEDCGVWLDTADLRRKRKPIRPPRPISRLLNPLGPSGAYRVPAVLSFTQTRLQFPATAQSSITSFLSPRRHGDAAPPSSLPLGLGSRITQSAPPAPGLPWSRSENKAPERVIVLSASCRGKEEAESAAIMATPLSPPDVTAMLKKRKHFGRPEEPANQRVGGVVPPLRPLPQDSAGGGVRGGCRVLGACSFPLPVEDEEEEPAKKRLRAPSNTETLPCHLTQRDPALSHRGEGKENSQGPPLPPSSPLSPKPTPWRRESPCLSPWKRPLRDLPETQVVSRSQLFTQDSEGRQVMAHRGAQRTPLLDCTNLPPCRELPGTVPSQPPLQGEPDSELRPELLFTQDSEGNRVIKH